MKHELDILLKSQIGFPKKTPYIEKSIFLHDLYFNKNDNILQGCYWIPSALFTENIKTLLSPIPKVSSLAPTSNHCLKLYYQHPKKPMIGVPKFFGMSAFGIPKHDLRKEGLGIQTIEWNSNFILREEQQICVENIKKDLLKWGGSFCIADCGFGKTIIIANLIFQLKKKSLVIVPTITLVEQLAYDFGLKHEIESKRQQILLNTNVFKLRGSYEKNHCYLKEIQDADIIIASLDSLALFQYPQEFWNQFGLVLFDEAHHMAAKTLSAILPHVPTKNIVGFSATPNRNDTLEHVLYWLLGPNSFIYQRLPSITGKTDTVEIIKCKGIQIEDSFSWGGKLAFAAMVNELAENQERNSLIIEKVKQSIIQKRKKILCITAFRNHCEVLHDLLKSEDITSTIIYSGKKSLNFENVLVATFGMLEEGFDDSSIDTLVLCTPRSSVQQIVGRIERMKEGKLKPIVYDIIDENSIFQAMFMKRKKFYTSRGFTIPFLKNTEVQQDFSCIDIEEEIL